MTRPEGRFQGPSDRLYSTYRLTKNASPTARKRWPIAYRSSAYTMAEIGRHFGVQYKTVSRAVKGYEWRYRQVAEGRVG